MSHQGCHKGCNFYEVACLQALIICSSTITEQHFVGADEKFAVKTAGIKEFEIR